MSDLIVKSKNVPDGEGSVVKVTPRSAGWEYVGFEVIRLQEGGTAERSTGGEEVCLVPVSGTCSVSSAVGKWEIGGRESPFDGRPEPGVRASDSTLLEAAPCVSSGPDRRPGPFSDSL